MKKITYTGNMDEEVIELCNAMNSLPGIETSESCSGHGKRSLIVFFKVHKKQTGLFFLARCTDRRYWEHGHKWK